MPPTEQNKPKLTPNVPSAGTLSGERPDPLLEPTLYTPESPNVIASPRKSRKKLILAIIAAIILVLGAAAGVLAYMLYQSPEKAVADALSNAINSKSVVASGDFKAFETASGGPGREIIAGFNVAAEGTKANGDINITFDNIKFGGAFVATGKSETYVKVRNIKGIIEQTFGNGVAEHFKPFIAAVSDRWIRLDVPSDNESAKELNKLQTCYNKASEAYYKSKFQREQIANVYRDNPLFKAKSEGEERVGNVDSLRISLTPDYGKYAGFVDDLKKTEVFKAIDKCNEGGVTKNLDESVRNQTKSDDNDVKFQLWVSKWGHEFTQAKVSVKEKNGSTSSLSLKPTFNKSVTIEKPTESMSFEQVLEAFNQAFLGGANNPDGDTQLN
ncbi:hypothetical protein TM7_0428 [candidate division TM7 genomosp. GTL1]|nr:hypothetical protein TM7_0428 [candidate division TM7 genomosp. GTL1]